MVVLNFSKFRRYSIKTCVRIVFAYAGSLFILFISGPGKKERWKGPKISWHCFGSLILPRFILEHKVSEAVTLLWASCFRHKPIGIYLSPRKPLTLITRAVVPNLYSSPTDSFLVYITFRVQLNPYVSLASQLSSNRYSYYMLACLGSFLFIYAVVQLVKNAGRQ